MKASVRIVLLVCGILAGLLSDAVAQRGERLPECEWCGASEAPPNLDWTVTIAGPNEPGERLVIEGTVYMSDGVTPAARVLLYAYHTNEEGVYPRRGDETGNAQRHGYLRGWLLTDSEGRYRISTIKPAPYPGRDSPAHVHMTVRPPGVEEYWLDSVVFTDDPLVTREYRAQRRNLGGSGIVSLEWDEREGAWRATRDIVLEQR